MRRTGIAGVVLAVVVVCVTAAVLVGLGPLGAGDGDVDGLSTPTPTATDGGEPAPASGETPTASTGGDTDGGGDDGSGDGTSGDGAGGGDESGDGDGGSDDAGGSDDGDGGGDGDGGEDDSGGSGDDGGEDDSDDGGSADRPPYTFTVTEVTPCGRTCRDVTVELTNNRETAAQNVVVETHIFAGNTTNSGARIWRGNEEVGEMQPGATTTATKRVSLGFGAALSVQQNDGWITIRTTVRSADVTRTFTERRDVT